MLPASPLHGLDFERLGRDAVVTGHRAIEVTQDGVRATAHFVDAAGRRRLDGERAADDERVAEAVRPSVSVAVSIASGPNVAPSPSIWTTLSRMRLEMSVQPSFTRSSSANPPVCRVTKFISHFCCQPSPNVANHSGSMGWLLRMSMDDGVRWKT